MKTAGVTLDFYDDVTGVILKEFFPTREDIPEVVKTAHQLTANEREVLRDEAFALVMQNEGHTLRKFACVDRGNTLLSALYFLETNNLLPEPAVKVACANLIAACEEFDLPTTELEKVAANTGMSRERSPKSKTQSVGIDTDWKNRTNLNDMPAGGASSGVVVPTASQMKTASVVDVTGLEPVTKLVKQSSSIHALDGKYPLESYVDVQAAVSFFDENYPSFSPIERHQYCVKTAARADELGIEVSELVRRYGSTEYAHDVEGHLISRIKIAEENKEVTGMYRRMIEKKASVEPEEFAFLLAEADRVSGLNLHWGGPVSDPYFATFGGWSKLDKIASWSWQSPAGDYVTGEELTFLARNGRLLVHKHFSSDVTDSFIKDPITIFESLPDTSKVILARLASNQHDGLPLN